MALSDKQGLQLELRRALAGIQAEIVVEEDVTLPMAAEADLAGGDSTTVELHAKVNAILAKLRTAGLLGV